MIDFNAYVGIPYETADCWSLVEMVAAELGYELPDLHSPEAGLQSNLWSLADSPEAGDIILFQREGCVYHIGIAVSGSYFLHTHEGAGAIIEKLWSWLPQIEGIYRYEDRAGNCLSQSI